MQTRKQRPRLASTQPLSVELPDASGAAAPAMAVDAPLDPQRPALNTLAISEPARASLLALQGAKGNVLICGFDGKDKRLLQDAAMTAGIAAECVTLDAVEGKLLIQHYDFLFINITSDARRQLLKIGALLSRMPQRARQTFPVAVFPSRKTVEAQRTYLCRIVPAYLMRPLAESDVFMILDSLPEPAFVPVPPVPVLLAQEETYLPAAWAVAA